MPQAPLLSDMQQSMLAHEALTDRPIYNMPLCFRLCGDVDAELLDRALGFVIRRHPVLSARYDVDVALPVAVPDPPRILRTVGTPAGVDTIAELAAELWQQPFDLPTELPVRASLWSGATGEHFLGLCVHHVAGDSWSLALLLRELGNAYGALRRGVEPDAPPAEDFFAYAAREQSSAPDLSWWSRKLSGRCPQPYPREAEPDTAEPAALSSLDLGLDAAATRGIRKLARTARVSPTVVLFTAVSLTVATPAAGGQASLLGLPVVLRDDAGLQNTLGPLLNTVPVATSWTGGVDTLGLVRLHADAVDSAVAHKDVPLSWILRAAAVPRLPGTAGLFLHVVNVDTERPRLVLAGAHSTSIRVPLRWAQVPACWEFGWSTVGNVAGALNVSADAFTTDQARGLVTGFRSALAGLLANQ